MKTFVPVAAVLALVPCIALAQGGLAQSSLAGGADSTSLHLSPPSSLGFNPTEPPPPPLPPPQCPTASVSWQVEGNACSGTLPGASSGMNSQAVNTIGGYSGASTYFCSAGAWSVLGGAASCEPNEDPNSPGEPQSFEVISTSDSSALADGHPIFTVPFDAAKITITLEQITPLTISALPQMNGCEIWYYQYGALGNGPPTNVAGFKYVFPVQVENAQGTILQTLTLGTQAENWLVNTYNNYSSNGQPCNGSSFYKSFSNSPLSSYSDPGDIGDMGWAPSITLTNVPAFSILDMSPYMTGSFPAPCTGTNQCAYGPTQGYANTVNDFSFLFAEQSSIHGAGTVNEFEYGFKITVTPKPAAAAVKKTKKV